MGPFHWHNLIAKRLQSQNKEKIYLTVKFSGVFGFSGVSSQTWNHYMFYDLDILDCAAVCSISYLLRENTKYFVDVAGDNQQPRIYIGLSRWKF